MSVHILGCLFVWFAFQVCTLFWSWLVRERAVQLCLPHGVEDGSVLHDAEQLVGGGHVVRNRPLAIAKEGVRRPDLADHQVVEPQDLDRTFELEPLVDPRLAEEHVHGVFLQQKLRVEGFISAATLPADAASAPTTVCITPGESDRWAYEPLCGGTCWSPGFTTYFFISFFHIWTILLLLSALRWVSRLKYIKSNIQEKKNRWRKCTFYQTWTIINISISWWCESERYIHRDGCGDGMKADFSRSGAFKRR